MNAASEKRSASNMTKMFIAATIVVGALFLIGGGGTAKAATAYHNGCSVTAFSPAPVVTSWSRVRMSKARATVNCQAGTLLSISLYADDGFRTEELYHTVKNYAPFETPYVNCNEDTIGDDELFTMARIAVRSRTTGQLTWGPWSRSSTYSYRC